MQKGSIFTEIYKKSLKIKTSDIYRGRSHIEYYNFCLQYEDHLVIARANGKYRVIFATTFLKNRVLYRWQQHKQKIKGSTTLSNM